MSLASEPVILDISPAGIAVILLNRPAKRNAMDELMIAQLSDAFDAVAGQDRIHGVFLKGAGDTFCAGADIGWMRRQGAQSEAENQADAAALARMLVKLHALPQLTVALVQGAAYGGGAGLVAACDYAVATQEAMFRFPEVRLGLTPATISPFVIEAVGARTARGLFASGLPFDAQSAARFGLVQSVVADAAALEAEMRRIGGLALENAPGAVAEAKRLAHDFAGKPIDDRLAGETAKRIAVRRASREGQEGLAAFLERRPPDWAQ